MTLDTLQKNIDDWIKEYGVRYFNPLTNMTLLSEEVGELARIMARTYGEQSYKKGVSKKDMKDEIGDIIFVLICIANQHHFSLEEIMKKNLKKKTLRDRDRHKNNPKLKQ